MTSRQSAVLAVLIAAMTLSACNGQKSSPPAASGRLAGGTSQPPPQSTPSDPTPVAAPAPAASPCDSAANPKRCFFSEPFTVSIVNVDHMLNAYHTIRMNVEVRNVGKAPVIVAYQANSGKGVDNIGNAYAVKAVPGGIPTDYGTRTDARLVLQPGEAHMGTFEAGGYRTEKDPSSFNYDMTIDELGGEKPNPVLREHAVYFREITPAMPGAK